MLRIGMSRRTARSPKEPRIKDKENYDECIADEYENCRVGHYLDKLPYLISACTILKHGIFIRSHRSSSKIVLEIHKELKLREIVSQDFLYIIYDPKENKIHLPDKGYGVKYNERVILSITKLYNGIYEMLVGVLEYEEN